MRRTMKRAAALLLTLLVLLSALPVRAQAGADGGETYADGVVDRYLEFTRAGYLSTLTNDSFYSSYRLYQTIEDSTLGKTLTQFALSLLGEDLTTERWIQHLATLMQMQELGFEDSLDSLEDFDTLKSFPEYAGDVASIVSGSIGAEKLTDAAVEYIGKLIGLSSDLLGMGVESLEQYQYILRVGRNYENHKALLTAIQTYAEDETLREAADFLLDTIDVALELQVDALGGLSADTIALAGKHILSPELFSYLKSLPEYARDPSSKALVDWSENTQKGISDAFGLGTAVFDLGIFAGDMLFGTTDTFKRYSEIQAIVQMTTALQNAFYDIVDWYDDPEKDAEWIAEGVPLLQAIVLLRMRGEYCNMSLVTEDAQFLSLCQLLLGDQEAQLAYFEGQTTWLLDCWNELNKILVGTRSLDLYYAYVRDVLVPELGLATQTELYGRDGYDAQHWADLNARGVSGLLSVIVCDLDLNGSDDMLTVSITPRDYAKIAAEEIYFSIDLVLYQIANGEVYESDRIDNAIPMTRDVRQAYTHMTVSLTEYEGSTRIFAHAYFQTRHSYDTNKLTECSVRDGQFIEAPERRQDLDYFTEDGEPYPNGEFDLDWSIENNRTLREHNQGDYISFINYDYVYDRPDGSGFGYIYRAEDWTDLAQILSGEKDPEYFDLLSLTSQELPQEEQEVNAQQDAFRARLADVFSSAIPGAKELGYNWGVSFVAETAQPRQIFFYTPGHLRLDEVDMDEVRAAYHALLDSGLLGLDAATIESMRSFGFERSVTEDYGPVWVQFTPTPADDMVLLVTITGNG